VNRIVVADTGPPHYLVLIGAIELLPQLFGSVLIPEAVLDELTRPRTPEPVREWVRSRPTWLEVRPAPPVADLPLRLLGAGERDAIALAHAVGAVLLLTDDRAAASAARTEGLATTGTLGVLLRSAEGGLVDLPAALGRLRGTNFRASPGLLDALLASYWAASDGGP